MHCLAPMFVQIMDGFIFRFIHCYIARSFKSLIFLGNKALLWSHEAKGMSLFVLHTSLFCFSCLYHMCFAHHWGFALLLFLRWTVLIRLYFSLAMKIERVVSHRDVDLLSAPNGRELVTFIPSSFWVEAWMDSQNSTTNRKHLSIWDQSHKLRCYF